MTNAAPLQGAQQHGERTPGTGVFVTFEGIDGAGKSSHLDALSAALRAAGREVVVTREPGGTPLAEQLRAIALSAPMDPLAEALVMFAARRDHLLRVIEPALERGAVVLCDRFTDSTFAYQGYGRGHPLAVLAQLESWVQAVPALPEGRLRQPDLTLWFDLAPAIAARRLADAREPDKFEAESVAFFTRVAEGFVQRAAHAQGRFVRIEADRPREVVWSAVESAVRARGLL